MGDAILLIGAGGFIGSHLLEVLSRRGEHVIAVGRHHFAVPEGEIERHIRAPTEVDDFETLLARARVVVHVASASTPGSSAGRPVHELDENVRPALALLEALQAHPQVPLVYVSSGGTLYSRVLGDAADELAAVYSRSYHGAGKIAIEHFIEAYCNQFSASATVLRPSNLYGPGQVERAGFGIVPRALGMSSRGELLHVWGDGSAERDYLYIDDFTRLLLAVMDAPPTPGFRIFNACSGTSIDLNGLFKLVERVTGRELSRSYDADRPVDVPCVRMRATRAREAFGWSAEIELADGLERTWRWFNTIPR